MIPINMSEINFLSKTQRCSYCLLKKSAVYTVQKTAKIQEHRNIISKRTEK